MVNQKILKNLNCLECQGEIDFSANRLTCRNCGKDFPIKDGILYFTDGQYESSAELSSDNLIVKLKLFFKRYPAIFNTLYYFFGTPFLGKSAKKVIETLGEDKITLNLGSGTQIIRKDVVNVDLFPFPNVDMVVDIAKLPLKENSVDAVICEYVLEHIKNPSAVVSEIKRVLKPGGLVYIVVPFVVSFHSSPNDYYRWSKEGLRELMGEFTEEELDIRLGPTLALLSIFNEWLATLFSFGSPMVQQVLLIILMVITFPLRFFDYLISKFPGSENIAYCFYYLGRKKQKMPL